jgi:hypothetical protein
MWDINMYRHWNNNAVEGWNSKQHYRRATALCFSAGTVIKRRSKVCTLAIEMKGTLIAWSITEKRRNKKTKVFNNYSRIR